MTIELTFQNLPDYITIELTLENIYLDGSAATHCNTLQHTATHCNTHHYRADFWKYLPRWQRCNTLQHTATHIPIELTFENIQLDGRKMENGSTTKCALQCVAVCCSALQCVAVCCSAASSVGKWKTDPRPKCVAVCSVCGGVLQCVAVFCSVLQCYLDCREVENESAPTICCSVLQCNAVCCSVLQCYLDGREMEDKSAPKAPYKCRLSSTRLAASVVVCVAMCCRVLQRSVAVCCSE